MKSPPLRLILALLTFAIGISFTAFWLLKKDILDVPIPQSQIIRDSSLYFESDITMESREFWNNEVLRRFKEEPLEKLADSTDESYRFVLIPTFDAPVSIRAARTAKGKVLVIKRTSGHGGFGVEEFGKLSYEKTQTLTEEQWQTFVNLLGQSFFWDMPSEDYNETPEPDGALWVMEGFNNQSYHQVRRISPKKEFADSCSFLLKSAGLADEYKGY